jgi:hypothetical protein
MGWVAAATESAEMIKLQSIGDSPDARLIRQPMSQEVLALEAHVAVTVSVQTAGPRPACIKTAALVDEPPDALMRGSSL